MQAVALRFITSQSGMQHVVNPGFALPNRLRTFCSMQLDPEISKPHDGRNCERCEQEARRAGVEVTW